MDTSNSKTWLSGWSPLKVAGCSAAFPFATITFSYFTWLLLLKIFAHANNDALFLVFLWVVIGTAFLVQAIGLLLGFLALVNGVKQRQAGTIVLALCGIVAGGYLEGVIYCLVSFLTGGGWGC